MLSLRVRCLLGVNSSLSTFIIGSLALDISILAFRIKGASPSTPDVVEYDI